MLKSMTAYGRAHAESEGAHFIIELQSLNRKHLEVQLHLPKVLTSLETEMRKKVQKIISRGQVNVRVQASFHDKSPYKIRANIALAKQLQTGWNDIAESLKLPEGDTFKLKFLTHVSDIFTVETNETLPENILGALWEAWEKAARAFNFMREKEGEVISNDMKERLENIRKYLEIIEQNQKNSPEKYRAKILDRLKEIVPGAEVDERIFREIALFAEKVNIDEECLRLKSHISQYEEKLAQETQGKSLEFLIQEMSREANTIGSKSQDLSISMAVIEIKSELEKMREQVQNVE